ncbi:MAG: DUF4492 domain-containing protein [Bacteroidales bacterium]|nr:DUF4492 domain-containing protein [Bacteroidales bacterium]
MFKAIKKAYLFYYTGFSEMNKLGKTLWIIILLKLFIMFAILKLFFFSNYLNSNYKTEDEKATYIIESLTNKTIE